MDGSQIQLFNHAAEGNNEKFFFEQYRIYVELVDRISQRRALANSFYITANAALMTVLSWFKKDFGTHICLISAIGIIIAVSWFFSIRSYEQLNRDKFKVICEIEKQLPLNLFACEWFILKEGKSYNTYWPLSRIERYVPLTFVLSYVMFGVLNYAECLGGN